MYHKQKKICFRMLHKIKKDYFCQNDNKVLNDGSKFWKGINPLFSENS